MTPDVSVVMTVYNAESTVQDAIASILAQSYSDWELVVVDDGSQDGTVTRVETFDDPRIRLIPAAHRGRSAAFNAAVEAASGDLIAVNDADDMSLSHRLQLQRDFLDQHPDVDVLGGHMRAFDERHAWPLNFPTEHEQIRAELAQKRMPIAHAACMFRREWFLKCGGLDLGLDRMEDFALYWNHRDQTHFAAVDSTVVNYRFKTLNHEQWMRDEDCYDRILGRDSSALSRRYRFARYRLAIWTQQHDLGLTRRSRGTTD